ncbi:MAG: biotin/lipoyl-binding protein [Lachnospiraceae bacterium]|nr:biotin/lipoyl-binding protein [Lachnospiraceae bacterium]
MNEIGTTKRRDWIKNAVIVFLIIMLLLTFFSNTIMNYSLPEVSAEYVSSSTITTKIRGTGTVEASDTWEVYTEAGEEPLKVISVEVKEGDEVEEGDVLFTLDVPEAEAKDTTELKEAQKKLQELREEYETLLLSADMTTETSYNLQTGTTTGFGGFQEQINVLRSKNEKLEEEIDIYENEIKWLEDLLREAQSNDDQDEYDRLSNVITINQDYVEEMKAEVEENKEEINDIIAEYTTEEKFLTLLQDMSDQEELIAELQAELNEDDNTIDPEIKAPVSGTIKTVNVRAGRTVGDDEVTVEIYPAGEDYTMTITVTTEQANSLSLGDVAELQNSWYYNDITVVLSKITTDTTSRGQNKILTFTVTGDVVDGQSLSISIGKKSATYSYTVPNSAVREDSNGKFVLIVSQKSSPLGNRYYAERMSVEALASDDSRTAVSGAFTGGEFVITTSTAPVEAGQLIRLAD